MPWPACGFLKAGLASEDLRLGCRARRSRQGFGVAPCIGRPSRPCRRAKRLQSTGRRLEHGQVTNQPAHKHSAWNQVTGGHDERFEHRSKHVACCRAFVGEVGRAEHSTAAWQDKSRRLRLGRAAEECRHIKHLARGATAHDSLLVRTTPCNFTTGRTSHTPAP